MISKLRPQQPDPRILKSADQELAKFGHLNWLIDRINENPGSGIQSVVGGTNITIDNTDPQNPVINATGGGSQNLTQVLTVGSNAGGIGMTNVSSITGITGGGTPFNISPDVGGSIFIGIDNSLAVQAIQTLVCGNAVKIGDFIGGNSYIGLGLNPNQIDIVASANINFSSGGDIDASGISGALIVGGTGIQTATISNDAGVTISSTGGNILLNPVTGWSLPIGTLSRTSFDQATVTLPQLAQKVAALITDLKTTVGLLHT